MPEVPMREISADGETGYDSTIPLICSRPATPPSSYERWLDMQLPPLPIRRPPRQSPCSAVRNVFVMDASVAEQDVEDREGTHCLHQSQRQVLHRTQHLTLQREAIGALDELEQDAWPPAAASPDSQAPLCEVTSFVISSLEQHFQYLSPSPSTLIAGTPEVEQHIDMWRKGVTREVSFLVHWPDGGEQQPLRLGLVFLGDGAEWAECSAAHGRKDTMLRGSGPCHQLLKYVMSKAPRYFRNLRRRSADPKQKNVKQASDNCVRVERVAFLCNNPEGIEDLSSDIVVCFD